MDKIYDLAILGAGPAGITCGIYAMRGNLTVAIIEGDAPGGKMVKTSFIENYPGFSKIEGPDLSMKMFEQLQELNPEYISYFAEKITKVRDLLFEIELSNQEKCLAKTIFIATGTKEKKLNIENEDTYFGKGISHCAVCDAALYKNQEMVVIGGGNSALEEALYLTAFSPKVHLVHRREEFRGSKLVSEKVKNHPKIQLHLNTIPVKFMGNDKALTKIILKNKVKNEEYEINTNIVFPFVGSDPITYFAKGLDVLNEHGYVNANSKMHTKVCGIYAGGDVISKSLRQIATAISDGAIAAQEIIHILTN